MQVWLCPLLAFLCGSIPFGLIIARASGIDIRKHGSGNIGATNVFRIVGKKHGLTCLLLDALKGFAPVVIAINLVRFSGHVPQIHIGLLDAFSLELPAGEQLKAQLIHVVTALAAVLGHNYSPWIGFRGGKGIATSAGVLIALMPMAVLILLVLFLITLIATRYVAVASMVAAASLPVLTHIGARFHGKWEDGTWNKPLFAFSLAIAILAIWKHRTNIRRLRDGTESRFSWGGKSKRTEVAE
ncbi:glycerol-3-phosphate 1-O-acyltransferase PlsY [Akkermansiaceae bacterium]|nr:glycerol-3-phosphate 1-O-acyltransferase PlsY [Akkermansiaceae bacterium]